MEQAGLSKKEVGKMLITLAIPTILEQILSTLLQYVDTAMVGHLGEQATAAVSITTTITWLFASVPSAIGVAVLALIARYYGGKEEEKRTHMTMLTVFLVVVSGIVLGAVCVILSPVIPTWMGAEPAIRKQASLYFAIISAPMVFRTASTVFASAMRAVKDTKTPMVISVLTNVCNILLNAVFIYACDLGVTGAAIASAFSYTFGGSAMYLCYRRHKELSFSYASFVIDKGELKECFQIALPVLATNCASCFGYVVFARLVSGMGTTVFAAHSIAVTAETIFYIPGYGLRTATSALIGISLGEHNRQKYEMVTKMSIVVTMAMMVFNGILLYVVSYPLMRLLTSSTQVAVIGASMLKLVAFSEPFFGLMIIMEGIFYGLGKTKYPFFVETFSMWAVRILFTALCVKVWNLSLTAVWCCMIADNVCKAVLLLLPNLSEKKRRQLFHN